ncbi:MAG: CD1871A family CXXC motif-containing protein [Candidatus Limivicinus sp.]|jgi:hypothetical protein
MSRINIKPLLLAAVAVIMIYAGVRRGEMKTVRTKAAAICMECIGIG